MKLLLVLAASLAVAAAGTVDPALSLAIQQGSTEAILALPAIVDQVQSNPSLLSLSGDAKVSALVASLQGLTSAAQAPYVQVASSLGLETQTYWGSNIIHVKGLTSQTLASLAATPGDFTLRKEVTVRMTPSVIVESKNISQAAQWGVEKIRAPEAWARTQGEGIVVCIIDTGVNLGHVALADAYGGAWSDPYYNTAGPTDQQGHGSHCTGTILGRANGVGVAPAAQWVACRGLNHQGSGTEANLINCAQWVLTANPRPNIVSNSWGGGGNDPWYNQVVSAWRTADIIPVFAIGNSGSSCRSVISPGDQPNLISVGATTDTDAMATFSSRGPNAAGALKPEVSAPGNNIVSCGTGANNYVTMSGTSMATPHTAGAIALLMSANPSFGYDEILDALSTSAAHPTVSSADRNCGLPGPGDFPNQAFGHGRIDIAAALGL
ncbi:bacillopeptidase F [Folsomia candida]|uniref:Bacillopeptidase F n=1 Tax=Folsomia candida TaxID=158441 RepID=A0A226F191_FOLCA|nr:bacillopeptidase F [Folsomia candida]OXA63248.1 Bacillopeptidase F [Folsomia candida]